MLLAELNEARNLALKLKPGQKFGSSDQDPPEKHTEHELSRVADLLSAAEKVGGEDLQKKVFALLPSSLKLEFNYAKWSYKATK